MLTKLTKKYINAFNDKNLNELETLFDENFALEDPVVKRIEGKEECLQAIKKILKLVNS